VIVRVPGDKSISQRALILAALADGDSRLTGVLPGEDPSSTAGALRALGARIGDLPVDGSAMHVEGRGLGGLRAPPTPLDLGNSGTGARLLMGVLAACPFEAVVTGDASLRARPMRRVTEPLSRMGARFEALGMPDRLPIRVRGGALRPLEYDLPVASAQIKSALLLAGLVSGSPVVLTEPGRSRDHTERMLRRVGVEVLTQEEAGRWRVEMRAPPNRLPPLDFHVPGDFSSAAFLLAAGLLGLGGDSLTVEGVGLNATRTGLLPLLGRMGGPVEVTGGEDDGSEPVGSLTVRAAEIRGIEVDAADVLSAIDEIPALVALAARAKGTTRITGAAELRVKETDRIHALVSGLLSIGVHAEELDDGLLVEGTDRPLAGVVDSRLDHRIAMAFGVLGALPGNDIRVEGAGSVDVSFPDFWEVLARVSGPGVRGAPSGAARAAAAGGAGARKGPVITLDGPAGSGKSTTAREVARRLGFRHLDSGALYRALAFALLDDGIDPDEWPGLGEADLARHEIRVVPGADERFDLLLDGRPLEDAALRGPEVTAHVSAVAGLPAVRAWLLERQREAGRLGDLVADGRDMGTVVFPEADLKVFLVADLRERARRRLGDHGIAAPTGEQVAAEAARLHERDERDSLREISPMRRPDDGWELDTTRLDFDAQVEAIVREVRARLSGGKEDVRAP
jgi:3-phosphoshikimate 1-carboxyvinyltransferase